MDENKTYAATLTDMGKALLANDDPRERVKGMRYIMRALRLNDPEAQVVMAELTLRGQVTPTFTTDPKGYAIEVLLRHAQEGDLHARAVLDAYCRKQYQESVVDKLSTPPTGPLVDCDGKRIKIKRKGLLTPVDAVLTYANGVNRLDLSLNVVVHPLDTTGDDAIADPVRFKAAVLDGLHLWEGRYLVFGNQPLEVAVHVTNEVRLLDSVFILPMTVHNTATFQKVADVLGTESVRDRTQTILREQRSFAVGGRRWSVRSRKQIFLFSATGNFDDYEEIKHVVKHEFGHVLGLGDLYCSPSDGLSGVARGSFPELDGYALSDSFYDLVMCDHHGVVGNNDIEMVVLAFRTNRQQLYQKQLKKTKISKALGQGN